MIEIIKFVFYILSTGFVVFNILDNILIESIKGRYSKVPGKFSNFGKIMDFLRDIFIAMIIIEYILSLITLFNGHLRVKHNGNMYFFIALIICLEAFFIIFYTFIKYFEVKSIFINALEGNEKVDDKNLINRIFSRNEKVNKEEWENKIYKNIKRANLFSNICNSIYLIFIINSIFKEDLFKYMDVFFNLLILLIVNILASSILSSLKKALQEVRDNKEYIFNYGENEYIKTKLYLDYKDEYLIIKDGYEIFIPKSNVKRKIVRTIE
ncbi:hypothetical protein GNF78_05425 [Clostridium perfringens]|uniref:hypothetical protein n=2 Tax=Clostridium perfringens TaxID=1502 RepID=UPI001A280529|nr:hypothetical protein [Clostridium perfringens]EIL8446969.1 hypothetical protein [Clostridium perfringens]ELC8380476.1 hypothetical protein [Clostridium perfringens]MDZ5036695.1 hypothetical protein [Clostridium perfringens]HAT4364709.1 hypothetical protein [Clostridium perfringens]HEF0382810.1 hypothetical protein [Clostridium perfringens]